MLNSYLGKIYKSLLIIAALLLQMSVFSPYASAQENAVTIKGKVVDGFGQPIAGVQVNVKNQSSAVATNLDGVFEIQAAFNDVLVFHHPAFDVKQKVIRSGQLSVRLEKSYLESPDTIDVLYGKQRADQVLGSISTIYNHQLITTPAAQYTFALPGRLPGLYTQQTSGWPSQSQTPLIDPDVFLWANRMAGTEGLPGPNDNSQMMMSLRGQSPVTIIDGVQRDFYSISPENIKSISVLKDALSTILLGQLSSKGVLLVTTKRPEMGGPRLSFTAQTAMQSPLDLPKPLPSYKYAWLYNEGLLNDGRDPVYSADDFQAYRDGSDPTGHPDINWYKAVLKDQAPMSRYDLNVSGGGDVARYSMGAGYMNKQGLFIEPSGNPYNTNAAINRYTVNTHVDVNANKYFNIVLDIFGRIENTNQPGAGISSIMNALMTTPNNAYPIFNPDGTLAGTPVYKQNIYGMVGSTGYIAGHNRDVMANVDLKYNLENWLPGLWAKFIGNVSISASDVIDRSKGFSVFQMNISPLNGDTTYIQPATASDQRNTFSLTSFAKYWYGQFSIGYDKQFGDNNISAMLFADRRQATINYDLPGDYTNIAAKVSYNRNEKYFAEGALNYSGFNRYPPGHRFGLFYAGGLGWDMSRENFIKDNVSWINRLKWRVTFGQTGNANVGYYVYKQYYYHGFFDGYNFGKTYTGNGFFEMGLPNPDVTWEKAHKLNVGLDVSLFSNHLQLTADYYRNRYYDLLELRGKTIALIGNTYPPENIGINRYTGEELSLTYRNNIGSFNWFVTANASAMQTKVLYMDEIRRDYSYNKRTGRPVGQLFGYIAEGLYQSQAEVESSAHIDAYTPKPGDIKYKDLNNDGVINEFDQTPIGNTKPLIYYGLTTGFSFKGLDVNVLFQGVENRSILMTGSGAWPFNALANGQAWEESVNRWTPQTAEIAGSPRLTAGINVNNMTPYSTYWIRSGNYIRLKNVEIGYNLPYKWTSKLKLGGVRFFANALNLFTHTPNEGMDPEISPEVSGAVYPIQRVINGGVTIRF